MVGVRVPQEYNKQQLRRIATVAAEVERISGGQLSYETFVIEGQDETGQVVQVYAARIDAGDGDTPEVHRGASFVAPAQALRQALHNYQDAHKGEAAVARGRRGGEADRPIVPGNVGSLDDVPAGGSPVIDE